jgi:hypothetical protein
MSKEFRKKFLNVRKKMEKNEELLNEISELKQRNSKLCKLLTICGHCGDDDCDEDGNCDYAFYDENSIHPNVLRKERLKYAYVYLENEKSKYQTIQVQCNNKLLNEITELKQSNSKLIGLLTKCGHCGDDCDEYGNCMDAVIDSSNPNPDALHELRLKHAGFDLKTEKLKIKITKMQYDNDKLVEENKEIKDLFSKFDDGCEYMELANKIVKLIEEDKINESFKYSNDYMRYMELEKKIRKEGVFEEYKEKKEPFNYSNNYMELNYMEFKNKMTKVQYDNNKLLEENKELKERFKEYSLNIHYMNGNINDIIHEMNGKFTFYELGFNPGLQW